MDNGVQIELIGAGGIVSNIMALLLPALRNGEVAEKLGGITFNLHDADVVEERNLIHQRFTEKDKKLLRKNNELLGKAKHQSKNHRGNLISNINKCYS